MEEKSFLIKLFFLIIVTFIICYAFILLIDPHQEFGFNEFNKDSIRSEIMQKSDFIENNHNKFEFFVIGSSASGYFDPSVIQKTTGYKTFIFSAAGLRLEEYVAIVDLISKTQKPKVIYLHQDIWVFNKNLEEKNRTYLTSLGKYLTPYTGHSLKPIHFHPAYFSLGALIDAIKVVKKWYSRKNSKVVKKVNVPLERVKPRSRPDKNKKVWFRRNYFKHGYYDDYLFDKTHAKKWLGHLKRIAEDNNINLIFGLPPMNKEHLTMFNKYKALKGIAPRVKKAVTEIFGSFYDFHNCSTHAFRGTEYWDDSVHPSPKLTNIMTQIILEQDTEDNVPELFGKKVASENISEHLLNIGRVCP
jgi:hypothetical protein